MLKWSTTRDKKGNRTRIELNEEFFDNSNETSVTDKSHYRPNAPAYARVDGPARVGLYDFNDGVDTGIDLSPLRSRGIDITELDAIEARLKSLSESQKNELKQMAAEMIVEESKKMEQQNKVNASGESSNSSTTQG